MGDFYKISKELNLPIIDEEPIPIPTRIDWGSETNGILFHFLHESFILFETIVMGNELEVRESQRLICRMVVKDSSHIFSE